MGMFSYKSNYISESSIDMDQIEAQYCFEENAVDSAYRIVAENTANWNSIMEAIGVDELSIYESTGSEVVYEAGTISGIFEKIKEFFKKLLEKIKGLFNKFMTVINSWTMSDKDFIKKYKRDIISAKTKDFSFKGYKFTLNALTITKLDGGTLQDTTKSDMVSLNRLSTFTGNDELKQIEDATKSARDSKDDTLDAYRGNFIKQNSKIEASDFSKELFEVLRNGDSTKQTLDDSDIDVSNLIITISDASKAQKNAKKAYDAIVRGINDAIKEIDNQSKEFLNNTPDPSDVNATKLNTAKIAYLTTISSIVEAKKSINTVVYGAYLQAIKDENRQAKAICVKLMTRKQPKNESASYYEEGSSMLSSISLK